MMKFFFCIAILIIPVLGYSQLKSSDDLTIKADSLKNALDRAASLSPEELYTRDETALSSYNINDTIADLLVRILSSPRIVNHDPESLLKHDFLGIKHSKDKRLWTFTWYENTGGSFQSCLSVVHFKTASNQPVAFFNSYMDEKSFSLGGSVDNIYKLPHPGKDLYLCVQSVRSCNTCCVNGVTVVELTKDSINFAYPAFSGPEKGSSVYMLEARCGSVEKFEYDANTSTLLYEYHPDDNTPIAREEAKTVKGKLKWNGKKFSETIKKI